MRQLELLGALGAARRGNPAAGELDDVDNRINHLADYDWLVFTSVNGVESFLRRLLTTGRDLRSLGNVHLAAIGPSTADALRTFHLNPDLVPAEYRSENLAVELRSRVAGKRVLLARADRGRDLLRFELAKVATVDHLTVYRQIDAPPANPLVLDAIGRGEIDFVTLTSADIARSF